jgi:ferredoxin/flavodoxin
MTKFQKATVFYFSGTGNAKQVAVWFSEFAMKSAIDLRIVDIAKCHIESIPLLIENALILIISPIHGFNYPKITLDFIRHFPKGNNRVVLMNTRAGMKIGKFITPGITGIAFLLSSFILIKKGYKVAGQVPFDMPSNWISIHPSLNEKTVKHLHAENYRRVKKHADRIFSGQADFLAYRDLLQDILISPIAFAYYCIGRFAFAKSFYATAKCDSCFYCIRQCPVQAIEMVNGHPFWNFKCESCMHCMNNCPKRAIETAHGLFVIVSFITSFGLSVLLKNLLLLEVKTSMVRLTLWSLIFLAVLWIFYYLQHLMLKNRVFSKLISLASLTHYRFWGRYKSIPDNKWKT